MWSFLIIVSFVVAFVFVVWAFWWIRRRIARLGSEFIASIMEHISMRVKKMPHSQQIIEYDKILDKILQELWYSGTLAQKLQQYQKNNALPQAVWNAHRERNNIVHELNYRLPDHVLQRHVIALERQVNQILRRGY
jgi:hypothetical protein